MIQINGARGSFVYFQFMWRIHRRLSKTIARQVLVLLAGAWLASAIAPCVMVDDCCNDTGQVMAFSSSLETCATAALDCQVPDPNPRSDLRADNPAPTPVMLALLPIEVTAIPVLERHWTEVQRRLPFTPLNLQHARLLI